MPRFGLKCFLGSFLLSLVAVFAVTKAYFVLSVSNPEQNEYYTDNLPTHNIELFAASEENDPLYDKFHSLNQDKVLPSDNIEIKEQTVASSDKVLYEPEESEENDATEPVVTSDDNDKDIVVAEVQEGDLDITDSIFAGSDEVAEQDEEDLQIADASTAPSFRIPLVHKYSVENGTVTYSDSADENQIAMASHDVNIDNLGTDKVAAVTEPLQSENSFISKSEFAAGLSAPSIHTDEPWKVAEVSNKNVGKNSLNSYTAVHKDSIVAPDVAEQPQEEYRMQDNLILPIPEDIRNQHNLTPQFSTSEENLRLERELRAKHKLPPLSEQDATNEADDFELDDEEQDFDEEEDEESSGSVAESITKWFSSSKKKSSKDNMTAPKTGNSKKNMQKSENSIFNKLLGIGKSGEENIIPSELKLSFQPNRAEISGQTLEWLHAFSDNSVKYDDVFIEIRIDKTAPFVLQEKRLKLLYKILASNGVDYHKINIIFTDREPNSFIIRNVRYASEDDKIKAMKRADNPWF